MWFTFHFKDTIEATKLKKPIDTTEYRKPTHNFGEVAHSQLMVPVEVQLEKLVTNLRHDRALSDIPEQYP